MMYKLKITEKDTIKAGLGMFGVSAAALTLLGIIDRDLVLEFGGIFLFMGVAGIFAVIFGLIDKKFLGMSFDETRFIKGKKVYYYTDVDSVHVYQHKDRYGRWMGVNYYVKVKGKNVVRFKLTQQNADLFMTFLKRAEVPFKYDEGFKV